MPPASRPPAGSPVQRWSRQVPAELSVAAGEEAVLPCTFTHPHGHLARGRAVPGPAGVPMRCGAGQRALLDCAQPAWPLPAQELI